MCLSTNTFLMIKESLCIQKLYSRLIHFLLSLDLNVMIDFCFLSSTAPKTPQHPESEVSVCEHFPTSIIYCKSFLYILTCVCVCAGKGVGCGCVRLPRSDRRGSVLPQGGADSSDGAHRCWVEERKTGGEGGDLPCSLHTVLPGYNTHTHSRNTHSKIHQKKTQVSSIKFTHLNTCNKTHMFVKSPRTHRLTWKHIASQCLTHTPHVNVCPQYFQTLLLVCLVLLVVPGGWSLPKHRMMQQGHTVKPGQIICCCLCLTWERLADCDD